MGQDISSEKAVTKIMKQKILGNYYIGHEQIQVVLREGNGAEYYTCPEKGSLPRIKIGMDQKNWKYIVGILIHEATEFLLGRLHARYEDAEDLGKDASGYLFVLNHVQLADINTRLADFLVDVLPSFAVEWKKWNKIKTK